LILNFIDFGCQGLHFSHNGKYLALAERKDSKDYISIYSVVKAWRLAKVQIPIRLSRIPHPLLQKLPIDTRDLQDFMWSPDDSSICAWDTPLLVSRFALLIFHSHIPSVV